MLDVKAREMVYHCKNNMNIAQCGSQESASRHDSIRYRMATHCQTVVRSGTGKRQNIGGWSTHFKAEKGGGGQLQTKNQIRVVTCKMCLFSIYFVKYMIFMT